MSGPGARSRLIELQDVHKTYGAGPEAVEALRGIDFAVDDGEFLGVVGPSGSGKTTLLNVLGGLDRPTSGALRVHGRELFSRTPRELARFRAESLGFVFQSYNLFAVLTAHENVEYPLLLAALSRAERRRRVQHALERVGLADKGRRYPDELSGGEKQRVAIARALVHRPLLVLADEPTANLDSGTGLQVIELLSQLNRELGTTFIISTHDGALIGRLRRVLEMRDGRVIDTAGRSPVGSP